MTVAIMVLDAKEQQLTVQGRHFVDQRRQFSAADPMHSYSTIVYTVGFNKPSRNKIVTF
jgi:hypothetical protein